MAGRTGSTIAMTVVLTLVVLAVAGGAALYAGVYDVAATREHSAIGQWILDVGKERSIAARADEVPPGPPADSALLAEGFEHYRAMCVVCHGAPGVERSEIGEGIMPMPPDLAEEGAELESSELFWVVKNGIKLAGMPAFGPTHSDAELWGIVRFVEQLATMSPEEYASLEARYGAEAEPAGHTHPPGTPPHEH